MTVPVAETIDGYGSDGEYPSAYHAAFAPPYIDAMLAFRGVAPPREARAPFTLVDLGCGDGIGLIASAVAHPEGRFIGIDASRAHIARGQASAAALGVSNIELRCARFADVGLSGLAGSADYVTAQGVIAWVSPENRARVFALAAALLRAGGVFTVGYNAMPGWQAIAPVQAAIVAAARGLPGSPADRAAAAFAAVTASGAFDDAVLAEVEALRSDCPPAYFAHEYLSEEWCPLASADVIAQAERHGLAFIGQAQPLALRDDLAFPPAIAAAIASVPPGRACETARDRAADTWFRIDSFSQGCPKAADAGARNRYWIAAAPADHTDYTIETGAGLFDYDSPTARAIVGGLETGPARLDASGTAAAIIEALWIGQQIAPADPPAAKPYAAAFNRWNPAQPHGGIGVIVGHNGAVAIGRGEAARLDRAALIRAGVRNRSLS